MSHSLPKYQAAVQIEKPKFPEQVIEKLEELRKFEANHEFWNNSLFDACTRGLLTREDFKYIFEQYYLYSKNFTVYLAGVMANCQDDF